MIIGTPDYSDYLTSLRDSVNFLMHRDRSSYDFDLRVGFESHAARANLRTRSMTEAA